MYLDSSLIYWHSKKQASVDTSTFGSKFIVTKHCMEYIQGLQFKLWMIEIRINGLSFVSLNNPRVPVLKNKYANAYLRRCER